MQFVEHNITKHHLFHAPHKWFLALLLSPIHCAEKYYQKKYHLQFIHAKKLFAFDITLLLSIIFLTVLTIFWFTYNPFISDQVELTIAPSTDKIRSGDYVTYTIKARNNSDTKLLSPKLIMHLPVGFVLDKAIPEDAFLVAESAFTLQNLAEKHEESVSISGWSFGIPNSEERVGAELSYQQERRGIRETKTTSLLQTHRDSILKFSLDTSAKIIANGTQPITLTITNVGARKIDQINLPLALGPELKLINHAPNNGEIKDDVWLITNLDSGAETVLKAALNSSFSNKTAQTTISLTPNIFVNNTNLKQTTLEKLLTIVRPQLNTSFIWDTEKKYAEPGEVLKLKTKIENVGDIDLQNINLEIPITTNLIDVGRLSKLNYGSYKNQKLTLNKNFIASFVNLSAQQLIDLTINLPIAFTPQGETDVWLSLNPQINGLVKDTESTYNIETQTDKIKVGTALNLQAETRYYTDDGDQLGRGPLPPRVDKETKYWALFKITNTTSRVANAKLTATLPDYVEWTGKTSVSEGNAIQYNEANKTISWSTPKLLPHSEIGVYFEIAITPTNAQVNTAPVLVKNIVLSGQDEFTGANILKTHNYLDLSLPADKMAQQRGIMVTY